jgi:molybdopterin-guanine dinucleotide biosynthesis protein A
VRIHGLLLTGGKSSRMGQDKATIKIGDQTLAERIVVELAKVCEKISVLGPDPVSGANDHIPDQSEYPGPLVAISRVQTSADAVLIASCDLPAFNADLIHALLPHLDNCDAVIPTLEGREQPLCALYDASCLQAASVLVDQGERRIMAWVKSLSVRRIDVTGTTLAAMVQNANTEAELNRALTQAPD